MPYDEKPRSAKPRSKDSTVNDTLAGNKAGSSLWLIGLGSGCFLLVLLMMCGGGVGYWLWTRPPSKPNDPIAKGVDVIKAVDPGKGVAALGKAPLTDLDPEIPVWDFAIRLPKNFRAFQENKKGPGDVEGYTYQWLENGKAGDGSIGLTKTRLAKSVDPVVFFPSNFRDPNSPIKYIQQPQPVEINGLSGARMWTQSLHPNRKNILAVGINYRYHVDGWAYLLTGQALGESEEAAQRKAGVLDVSICTFRKR